MVFKERFWAALRDGSLTVAYRRWTRPSVRPGGTLQSPGGLLAIDAVDVIGPDEIDEAAARAAGYRDRRELFGYLRGQGQLYRIRFHRVGDDPRIALRQRAELTEEEWHEVDRMLGRNRWAVEYLRLIGQMPAVVSTELAERAGIERLAFKQRVRRLKALGLTESLEVGYRLSPRGRAVLARADAVTVTR